MKSPTIKKADAAFATQMLTFAANIASYPGLGLTAAQITAQNNDAQYFNYVLVCQSIMQAAAQQWTAWKNLLRAGNAASTPPAPVTLPAVVPPVAPGVEARFRALTQQVKSHPSYNEAIGQALGIEGDIQSGPDLMTIQPVLNATVLGMGVQIDWGFGGFARELDGIEIEVDRGDNKGFNVLTSDSTPGYLDATPFPATPAKWTYRAIYRIGDQRVGQWSNPVSVMVGG